MQIDIQKIKDRIFSNETVRLKIARDFGLTCIASDANSFAVDVLHQLGQKPSPFPLDQERTNSDVFRAAVRALGSNQRKWADYCRNEAHIRELLCDFNPVEAVQDVSVDELKRWLPGQTSSADAKAIMEWAKLLATTDCYYQSVKHLGLAFRALSTNLYHDELINYLLLVKPVGQWF